MVVHLTHCACRVAVSAAPVVTLPSTTVATPVESIQQRLLMQLAQSSSQPGAARPAISVIQLRPGSTAAPPTTLALPPPLAIRSGQPLTLVAAPTTSAAVRLNQVFVPAAALQIFHYVYTYGCYVHPSSRQHTSNDDCLVDKRTGCQNCSVLCCIGQLCRMIRTHI